MWFDRRYFDIDALMCMYVLKSGAWQEISTIRILKTVT